MEFEPFSFKILLKFDYPLPRKIKDNISKAYIDPQMPTNLFLR